MPTHWRDPYGKFPHSDFVKPPPPIQPIESRQFIQHMFPEWAEQKRLLDGEADLINKQHSLRCRQAREKLDKEVDWDGTEATPPTVVSRLFTCTGVLILVQDVNGQPTELKILPEDVHLLPPGKYSVRTLLKVLAAVSGNEWKLDETVVILRPRQPVQNPFSGTGNLIPGKSDKDALWELKGEVAKFVRHMTPAEQQRLFDELKEQQRQKNAPGDAEG